MEKPRVTRSVIHIVSRHSNWSAAGIKNYFRQEGVYANSASWSKFIDLTLLGLGAAFSVIGIILFFAYNWHNLHKFVKLGLTQGVLIALIALVLFTKFKPLIKNILLASAAVLVGILFSVFGQIYQTGADAYDFFLGWTIFMAIWALVSDFAVLWLILVVLVNTTLVLYVDQVGPYWSTTLICTILFILNAAVVVFTAFRYRKEEINGWFSRVVGFGAVVCITIGLMAGILSRHHEELVFAFPVTILLYSLAIYYAFRQHQLYYLCIIPISVILVLTTLFLEYIGSSGGDTYLVVSLMIIISITGLVRGLIKLTGKWNELNN